MMRRAVLALACASARGLVPPSLPPPRRASALAVHDPTAWLDALSSLLSAEGPEIEGAGAPVGPIAQRPRRRLVVLSRGLTALTMASAASSSRRL